MKKKVISNKNFPFPPMRVVWHSIFTKVAMDHFGVWYEFQIAYFTVMAIVFIAAVCVSVQSEQVDIFKEDKK